MEKRSYSNSLHGKIMNRALLIGSLPLIIIGGFWIYSFQELSQDATVLLDSEEDRLMEVAVGQTINGVAELTISQVDNFLRERIADTKDWASTPVVINAAVRGGEIHADKGWPTLSVNQVEQEFPEEKSLNVSQEATDYLLRQIDASPYFGEIFFTDRYGFNVALTNPTSDFVQRDENWWKKAWENGISIGEIEFDQSAKIWSVSISIRIDDPITGNSEGVMKAVLDISPIQDIADAQTRLAAESNVLIVAGDGLLIAETESGHRPARVMNKSVNLRNDKDYTGIVGNEEKGFFMTDVDVIGFAESARSEYYGEVVPGFDGFSWRALVRQPNAQAMNPVDGLKQIKTAIVDYRSLSYYILAATTALIIIVTILLARGLARKISEPLNQLKSQAELISKGRASEKINIESSQDEIEDLAHAFERMRSSIAVLLRHEKMKKTAPSE